MHGIERSQRQSLLHEREPMLLSMRQVKQHPDQLICRRCKGLCSTNQERPQLLLCRSCEALQHHIHNVSGRPSSALSDRGDPGGAPRRGYGASGVQHSYPEVDRGAREPGTGPGLPPALLPCLWEARRRESRQRALCVRWRSHSKAAGALFTFHRLHCGCQANPSSQVGCAGERANALQSSVNHVQSHKYFTGP